MQKLILLLSVLLSISSFAQSGFVITGKLVDNSYDSKSIYLSEINEQGQPVVLDSCIVKENTFILKGKGTDMPSIGIVASANKSIHAMVVLEPGEISISFFDSDSKEPAKVGGTAKNDEFWAFINSQNQLSKQMDTTSPEQQPALIDQLKDATFTFAKNNSNNRLGELMLIDIANVLTKKQVTEIFSATRPQFKNSEIGRSINAYLLQKNYEVGDTYSDIKLQNPEGKEVSLSEYIGKNKVVLIDFWASWCGPCRREIPHLISAYSKYKAKGFEIVGVSLDQDETSWKSFIKTQKLIWPQMSDLKGWQSLAAQVYGVKSIPLTLLVDENGLIIAKNLRGEQLSEKLEELLK